MIYFDNGATTRVDPRVVKAMLPYFTEYYGNPSSIHSAGIKAREAIEKARKTIAEYLGVKPTQVIFTSGGSESDNLAIKGVAEYHGKGHIITSQIEHPAVLRTCEHLEKQGFEVTYLPVNKEGLVTPEQVSKAIKDNTILVSIMHANNEIGTIQPIKEIARVCHEKKVLLHTDAVQSFTKTRISDADLISISSHKIHGPKGVGALIVKTNKIVRQIDGGGQENGLRAGTENVPGIIGLAKAVTLVSDDEINKIKELRDYIIKELLKIPNSWINGSLTNRLCNNINITFKGAEGESILLMLDDKGIMVSTGSACSSKNLKPSHVLTAIGLKPEDAHGTIRITLSRFNTKKEADELIKALKEIIPKLREMNPLNV